MSEPVCKLCECTISVGEVFRYVSSTGPCEHLDNTDCIAALKDRNKALERENTRRCEHCGSNRIVDNCAVCGAPQCCSVCCQMQELERERDEARGRWQSLVNVIADAHAAGVVYGGDDEAVEEAKLRVWSAATLIARVERERDDARADERERLISAINAANVDTAEQALEVIRAMGDADD